MSDEKFVWVEMEILKDADSCNTIRGKINADLLDEIIAHTYKGHFFRLDNAHWVRVDEDEEEDKKTMTFRLYGHSGPLFPMKGHTYMRTQDIREVSPLIDNYEEIYDTAKFQDTIEF